MLMPRLRACAGLAICTGRPFQTMVPASGCTAP
jgi:hypothetical protein